jgi:hypothetical protein
MQANPDPVTPVPTTTGPFFSITNGDPGETV